MAESGNEAEFAPRDSVMMGFGGYLAKSCSYITLTNLATGEIELK